MKEQIVDCGEETQPTDLGVATTGNGNFFFFFFENQEKELFLVDNTNSKRQLRKEQIVDCGKRQPRSGSAINQ